jgi:hypothetical protein
MDFKPANEALEEAWYDSFRNLATAARGVAGDVKKSAGGRVQAAAQTNLQKDISKNLFSMIITAQKLQNLINSAQEFSNKETLIQNLTNIEDQLQNNYTMLTGRDYTSKAVQPEQPPRPEVAQKGQTDSNVQDTLNPGDGQISGGNQPTQNFTSSQQPEQQKIDPRAEQVFASLKSNIQDAFTGGTKSMEGSDASIVFQDYKRHINNAIKQKNLNILNNLTRDQGIRGNAKKLVSQLLGLDTQQEELEESHSKPSFKIKIG